MRSELLLVLIIVPAVTGCASGGLEPDRIGATVGWVNQDDSTSLRSGNSSSFENGYRSESNENLTEFRDSREPYWTAGLYVEWDLEGDHVPDHLHIPPAPPPAPVYVTETVSDERIRELIKELTPAPPPDPEPDPPPEPPPTKTPAWRDPLWLTAVGGILTAVLGWLGVLIRRRLKKGSDE